MNNQQSISNEPKYINPYLGGVLLGLLVLITVFIPGADLEQAAPLRVQL